MPTLGPEQHALLFAGLAGVLLAFPDGEAVVRAGVRQYGLERGGRMAQRARAARHPLDMTHYLAYSEWRAEPGASERHILQAAPDAHMQITRCPWQGAWAAEGLESVGRLYCEEVDPALVRGFNPALALEVRSLLTAGAACCDFLFCGADMAQPVDLPPGTVQPWEYHLAHLYATLRRVAVERLGLPAQRALRLALEGWGARWGVEVAEAILAGQRADYSVA